MFSHMYFHTRKIQSFPIAKQNQTTMPTLQVNFTAKPCLHKYCSEMATNNTFKDKIYLMKPHTLYKVHKNASEIIHQQTTR
jgi:hypothetical protein